MNVLNVDFYFDGGTARIKTDVGDFYVDRRLKTNYEGYVFDRYPDDCKAFIVCDEISKELLSSLSTYDSSNDKESTSKLIEDMKKVYGS